MKRAVWILAIVSAVLAGAVVVLFVHQRTSSTIGTPSGRRILYYRNPMNPAETSPVLKKAPDGMDFVPVYADEGTSTGAAEQGVRIDPAVVQNMGVRIETVVRRDLSKVIRTVGQVDYDETRLFDITTKFSGYIDKLYIDFTGQRVGKDQPLLEIYSPDVVSTEEEYVLALKNVDALGSHGAPDAIASAKSLVDVARRRLELWDIPEHEITDLERTRQSRRTVMLHSPVNGIVVDKMVLPGAAVEAGMKLFKIADLSRVWVYAEVFEYELPWVKVGEDAEVELSFLPGRLLRGRVVYIDPQLSPETRTVRVRIELPNPEGAITLRPNMFATVRLLAPPLTDVLAVSDQAVIRSGARTLVVLALGDGRFASRDVKLGVTADSLVQVIDGIAEGDRVVTSGQFLIDSESNLRTAVRSIAPPSQPSPAKRDTIPAVPGMDMPGMQMGGDSAGRGH
jgi:RND family efflux transporter MFP subunit